MDTNEAKIQSYLNAAIDAEREGNKDAANRNFKFAAFYEAKRLGLPSPKDYAQSVGDVL